VIQVTPEMREAGGWAHTYWRLYSDEPSDDLIAESIFGVMIAVASGRVTLDQVRAHVCPKTGDEFFRRLLSDRLARPA
jgi:hypothetical protein